MREKEFGYKTGGQGSPNHVFGQTTGLCPVAPVRDFGTEITEFLCVVSVRGEANADRPYGFVGLKALNICGGALVVSDCEGVVGGV